MQLSRTQNATRNAVAGVFNRVVGLLIPFVLRTALIKVLGEQYLGLNNLFASILQVLNLADLGFSSAIVYSMYEPIAQNDTKTINALLNLYRKIYRGIGCIILLLGLAVMPFLECFIAGEYPKDLNLELVYLLYLLNTVIGYTCFAHRKSLLSAFQRSDIDNNVSSVVQIIIYILKLALLFLYKNYYLFVVFVPIATLVNNIITAVVSYRMFPSYRCEGKLDLVKTKEITKRVGALTIQKFGNTISTSLDSIVISSFLGLTISAIYSNYFYIVSALISFIWVCVSSATAGIGNSIVKESVEKNYTDFKLMNMLNQWCISWCAPCLLCLYQHFMKLWVGEELTYSFNIVICMVLFFYVAETRKVVLVYKDAAGMWWADKWKPLVGCLINLVFNVISVQYIGIIGVILSTIISYLFVELPWETHVFFKNYFKKNELLYYKELIKYLLVTVVNCLLCWFVCNKMPNEGVLFLILKGCICFCIANIFFYFAFHNTMEFKVLKAKIRGKRLVH